MRTQKAKGIIDGLYPLFKDYIPQYAFRMIDHELISKTRDISDIKFFPRFARPCPVTPKHGFVDSRLVYNTDELKTLWKEVIAVDKEGEIVLGTHFENITHNLVYVNSGLLSVGPGNDGATAGKDSISIPVAPECIDNQLMNMCGLDGDDTIYVEAIHNNKKDWCGNTYWHLAQIRGGPSLNASSPDFIPKEIVVTKVIIPNDDLLQWEQDVKTFKPGTVVYGNGFTLASHAAIHCVLHGIPFLTTKNPKVGTTLKPTTQVKNNIRKDNFRKGVRAAIDLCREISDTKIRQLFYFSGSVLHNWAYIQHSEHADWILGAASTIMSKLCMMMVLGEWRHKNKEQMGRERHEVYKMVLKNHIESVTNLPKAFKSFYSQAWKRGYGGTPWATCAWYTYSMWENIVTIYNKPAKYIGKRDISKIVGIMNKTMNLAHNNGWWFNKIASSGDLDYIANKPGFSAMSTSNLFYDIHKKVENFKDCHNLKSLKKVEAPFHKDKEGRIAWLKLKCRPSYNSKVSVELSFEDGTSYEKCIDLNCSEITNLKKIGGNRKITSYRPFTFPVENGKFYLSPNQPRKISTVFGVK